MRFIATATGLLFAAAAVASAQVRTITIMDPLSGIIAPGNQQPAGTATGYQQDFQVEVHWSNYGPGFYSAGSIDCSEAWGGGNLLNDFWGCVNAVYFQGPGNWSIIALLIDPTPFRQIVAADSEGGSVLAP